MTIAASIRRSAPALAALVCWWAVAEVGVRGAQGQVRVIGPAVCATAQDGECVEAPQVQDLVVSPDARHLYALNWTPLSDDDVTVSGVLGWARGADGAPVFARPVACATHAQFGAHPAGCARVRGWPSRSDDDGFNTPEPRSVVISPDGRHVYAAVGAGIAVFARDAETGALTQLPGAAGCLVRVAVSGTDCMVVRGIRRPRRLAISGDGRSIYVGFRGRRTSGVGTFRRDPATGALTQPAGALGCVSDALAGCARARNLNGVTDVAVAPDGRAVYVTVGRASGDTERGGVVAFARDPDDGGLAQFAGARGCVSTTGARGCRAEPGIGGLGSMAVAPDSRALYTTAFTGTDAPRRHRLAPDGSLGRSSAPRRFPNGDTGDRVAVGADGAVVAAGHSFGVYVFADTGGALRLRQCWAAGSTTGCTRTGRVFGYPGGDALTVAADGVIHVSGEDGLLTVRRAVR